MSPLATCPQPRGLLKALTTHMVMFSVVYYFFKILGFYLTEKERE